MNDRRTGRTFRSILSALLFASEHDGARVEYYVPTSALGDWTFDHLVRVAASYLSGIEANARTRLLAFPNGSSIKVMTPLTPKQAGVRADHRIEDPL